MKLYGIKTCGSVKKAMKYFKDKNIDFEFIDFKTTPVDIEKIQSWLAKVPMEILLNTKGTKYKTLKLKELNLDEAQKLAWLAKENLLIKRPVIEFSESVVVAFDEEKYNSIFK